MPSLIHLRHTLTLALCNLGGLADTANGKRLDDSSMTPCSAELIVVGERDEIMLTVGLGISCYCHRYS